MDEKSLKVFRREILPYLPKDKQDELELWFATVLTENHQRGFECGYDAALDTVMDTIKKMQ